MLDAPPVRRTGLPPLTPPAAAATIVKLLILGSMPGVKSLADQQYYAHPHNRFWPFMEEIFEVPRVAPYEDRVALLVARGIAVWDVLKHCERPGSLDASILRGSETANDFEGFLARHPGLRAIAFNGRAAEAAFHRHVLNKELLSAATLQGIELKPLPSTSPANASLKHEAKLAAWSGLRAYL